GAFHSHEPARPRVPPARGDIFGALDALHPDLPDDDPRWVRCAVYTRQSVKRPGDDPAVTSCAIQRTLCTEFIRNKTWDFWYPIAERFDDEGESAATLERPGLAKLLRRVEEGDVRGVIVYRVDRLRVRRRLRTLSVNGTGQARMLELSGVGARTATPRTCAESAGTDSPLRTVPS